MSEWGPHETLQFFVSAIASAICAQLLLDKYVRQNMFLFAWIAVAFLGTLYIAGEEISWGQWIFEWTTPEHWAAINDQQETNLHNTSSWLDQKPRLLLEIGMIVGGIFVPLIMKFKPSMLPIKFRIIYPPIILLPSVLCAELPKIVEKIGEAVDVNIFIRVSEINEFYMFYFVLLYVIILSGRIKDRPLNEKG
ncbi:MAG: hypothetical protein CL565_06515 [Alphaproteobacteria bacterium]|nr:hypothetical protein [Alphaproteobacteria bacterium]